jgi:hypothetical protein
VHPDGAALEGPTLQPTRVEGDDDPAPFRDRGHGNDPQETAEQPHAGPRTDPLDALGAAHRDAPEIEPGTGKALDAGAAESHPDRHPPPIRPGQLVRWQTVRTVEPTLRRPRNHQQPMVDRAPEPRVCPRRGLWRHIPMRCCGDLIRVRLRGGSSHPAPEEARGGLSHRGPLVSHAASGLRDLVA